VDRSRVRRSTSTVARGGANDTIVDCMSMLAKPRSAQRFVREMRGPSARVVDLGCLWTEKGPNQRSICPRLATNHFDLCARIHSDLLERDIDIARARAALERGGKRRVGAADGGDGLDALLPAALGDVDRRALGRGRDAELGGAGRARRGLGRALALRDLAGDAAADLELRDVDGVRVELAVGRSAPVRRGEDRGGEDKAQRDMRDGGQQYNKPDTHVPGEVHLTFDTAVRRGRTGAASADARHAASAKRAVNCMVRVGCGGEVYECKARGGLAQVKNERTVTDGNE
jgi:hypothetical protein